MYPSKRFALVYRVTGASECVVIRASVTSAFSPATARYRDRYSIAHSVSVVQ
jgi:hypothetical protein